MKKRLSVLVVFLLALYIIPSILGPSSSYATILAGPNMAKDFSTSGYGDESPQSITSFSETLPDDVLFRLDNESYGEYSESFAAVADWTVSIGDVPTSDGDLISLKPAADDVFDKIYTNVPSMTNDLNYYWEYRAKANATSNTFIQFYGYESNGASTSSHLFDSVSLTTSWASRKGIITHNGPLESISCLYKSSVASNIQVDYLRISLADELGWQHDGSETIGILSPSGDSFSTDGDILELESDADGGDYEILVDNTTTKSTIESDYYQFLTLDIVSLEGNGWALDGSDAGGTYRIIEEPSSTETGTIHYNIKALGYDFSKYRITLEATTTIRIDFIKAYSIANFTYTGTGVSLDDYLYVSSGTLYCSGTSFTSIVLDHDPALSVVTSTYAIWNVTTGLGTPQFDHYVSAWIGYSSATQGNITDGTLTDIRIKFTASANIAAIKFIDIHDWHLIVTVIILFTVPIDETALNWFIIFLGLFMIPASTLYLVKGGRDGMSANKFFYFCIAFMLGWGLLLGGIMG